MWSAWVGDSRAVVVDAAGGVRALTDDHNVRGCSREELQRVADAGGTTHGVYLGAPGVDGMMQLTRSLGDAAYHRHGVVSSVPECRKLDLSPDDRYVVVASDGLWENVASAGAGVLLRDAGKGGGSLLRRCVALEAAAVSPAGDARASGDDVTIVLLELSRVDEVD